MFKNVLLCCLLLTYAAGIESSRVFDEDGRLKAEGDWTTTAAWTTPAPTTTRITTAASVGTTPAPTPSPISLLQLALRGYEYVQGLGYYKTNNVQRSWLSAKRYCESEGSHLVVINSENEAINLRALMQHDGGSGHYWVGGHDLDEEGNYVTIFRQSLASSGYSNWYPGEPDGDSAENCLAFYYGSDTNSGLVDESCTNEHWTVCELEDRYDVWSASETEDSYYSDNN